MSRGAKKNGELAEGRRTIKDVGDDTSRFRGTPYYWAEASFPFPYALACVEVVPRSSQKAGVLYNRIVESWSDARAGRYQRLP